MNEGAWSTDGMTLTEETRRTHRKTFPSVTLCSTDYTRNGLRLNTASFVTRGKAFRRYLYRETETFKKRGEKKHSQDDTEF